MRLALANDVPIVPVVAIGGQETALFLTRGERLSRALALDRLLRLKVVPVQLAPPFGITILDLPGRIPLPSQITIQVLPKIEVREQFGSDPDERAVYTAITTMMQGALDELARDRDLPVVGSVGAREQRSEVAEELAAGGIEGVVEAAIDAEEPWSGYSAQRVPEVVKRLRGRDEQTLEAVRDFERRNKARKGVLEAVERESARRADG